MILEEGCYGSPTILSNNDINFLQEVEPQVSKFLRGDRNHWCPSEGPPLSQPDLSPGTLDNTSHPPSQTRVLKSLVPVPLRKKHCRNEEMSLENTMKVKHVAKPFRLSYV